MLLKRHRLMVLSFGVPLAVAFLVPLVAVFLMPGAVAGATLMARNLLDEPTPDPVPAPAPSLAPDAPDAPDAAPAAR